MEKILSNKILKLILVLPVLWLFQSQFLGNYFIKSDTISSSILFLSIIFGFYITSLAIFSTSSYVANLYKILDTKDKRVTLLHTLIKNYKFGLIFILISILYLLIIQLILNQFDKDELRLGEYYILPFTSFIISNFWHAYKMLNDLTNVIIQESKSDKRNN